MTRIARPSILEGDRISPLISSTFASPKSVQEPRIMMPRRALEGGEDQFLLARDRESLLFFSRWMDGWIPIVLEISTEPTSAFVPRKIPPRSTPREVPIRRRGKKGPLGAGYTHMHKGRRRRRLNSRAIRRRLLPYLPRRKGGWGGRRKKGYLQRRQRRTRPSSVLISCPIWRRRRRRRGGGPRVVIERQRDTKRKRRGDVM